MWNEGAGNCDKSRKRQNGRAAARFFVGRNEWGARRKLQNPNLFCPSRRKDSAPREYQSWLGKVRCRGRVIA
jgi:hypothetical protein